MNPTIQVTPTGDTGTLTDTFRALPGTTKTVLYAGTGALLGHLMGKHALIGGIIGLAGGLYLANKAAANGASNPNIPAA